MINVWDNDKKICEVDDSVHLLTDTSALYEAQSDCSSLSVLPLRLTQQSQSSETGRSMVEMLGTLAIMGVLSVIGVVGYNWAMNKHRANALYQDMKLAYMSIHTTTDQDIQWHSPNFRPKSNYELQVRRDMALNSFVLARAVPQPVCASLLTMAQDSEEMVLYNVDSNLLICDKDQDIVASFSGEVPLVSCQTGSQCPSHLYCDTSQQVCLKCPLGETPSADQMRCENLCPNNDEVTCISEQDKTAWCCPNRSFCSQEKSGECVASDGLCIFNFHDKTTEGLLYSTNCSYYIGTEDVVESYGTDCAYNVTADGTVTADSSKKCGTGKYCLLNWTNETWGKGTTAPTASADYVGKMYGKCQMMSTNDATPIITYKAGGSMVFANKTCPSGQYCLLNWTQPSWPNGEWSDATTEPTASAEFSGLMYGKCQMMSTNDASPIVEKIDGGNTTYTIEKECPPNQYCHLKWANETCEDAEASISGSIYGACVPLNINTATCPVVNQTN